MFICDYFRSVIVGMEVLFAIYLFVLNHRYSLTFAYPIIQKIVILTVAASWRVGGFTGGAIRFSRNTCFCGDMWIKIKIYNWLIYSNTRDCNNNHNHLFILLMAQPIMVKS